MCVCVCLCVCVCVCDTPRELPIIKEVNQDSMFIPIRDVI